ADAPAARRAHARPQFTPHKEEVLAASPLSAHLTYPLLGGGLSTVRICVSSLSMLTRLVRSCWNTASPDRPWLASCVRSLVRAPSMLTSCRTSRRIPRVTGGVELICSNTALTSASSALTRPV